MRTSGFCQQALRGLLLGGLLAGAIARGQLTFGTTERQAAADPDALSLALEFPFRNTGTTPVTVTTVRTCCGCTSAELTKRCYAPGEAGAVTLKFVYADLTGRQRRTVYVDTDDAASVPLTIDVTITERMTVTPRLLAWRRGAEAATPQVVTLTLAPGENLRPEGVSCEPAGLFAATLRPVAGDPLRYEVAVTPLTLAHPAQAVLTVQTNRESQRAHRWRAALAIN